MANITGTSLDDTLTGTDGDDRIQGDHGIDLLFGGAGNDTLIGGTGLDTMTGGTGNDLFLPTTAVYPSGFFILHGDQSDLYLFDAGFGQDTISETFDSWGSGAADTIRFGAGIGPDMIGYRLVDPNSSDLVMLLNVKGTGDSIQFNVQSPSPYAPANDGIEYIEFHDGTRWFVGDLVRQLQGTSIFRGTSMAELIQGSSGNDTLIGDFGGDTLIGGAGNDLFLGSRNDTRTYQTYDRYSDRTTTYTEYLGDGSDTYVFARGFGQDYIAEGYDVSDGVTDTIEFTGDISPDEITVGVNRTNTGAIMALGLKGSTDIVRFTVADPALPAQQPSVGIEQIRFADGTTWRASDLWPAADPARQVTGTPNADTLLGGVGADTLTGEAGNDRLDGLTGHDWLDGGEGNDTLIGLARTAQAEQDTLLGGAGDDLITIGQQSLAEIAGGTGRDTISGSGSSRIRFDRGDGTDVLTALSGNHQVVLGSGLARTDMSLQAGPGDVLTLSFGNDDAIVLQNISKPQGISLQFTDGSTLTQSALLALATQVPQLGTAGPDSLSGFTGNDTLQGLGGQDTLNGAKGDDWLEGGEGDDLLQGNEGNDTLTGGAGNDTLVGRASQPWGPYRIIGPTSSGQDTYLFGAGDGHDVIEEDLELPWRASSYTPIDTLEFLPGVRPEDVTLSRIGPKTLKAVIGNGSDSVIFNVPTRFGSTSNELTEAGIEKILFADGTQWNGYELLTRFIVPVLTGTAADDTLTGIEVQDTLMGLAGNDTLIGGNGLDTFIGGPGNDVILQPVRNTEYGTTDTIIFGRGDGHDTVYVRDYDTVVLGAGLSLSDMTVGPRRQPEYNGPMTFDLDFGQGDVITTVVSPEAAYSGSLSILDSNRRLDHSELVKLASQAALVGTDQNDTLVGWHDQADMIAGGKGDDVLRASSDNDTLLGGEGNDQLTAMARARLNGGAGDDVIETTDASVVVFEAGGGHDTVRGGQLLLGDGLTPQDMLIEPLTTDPADLRLRVATLRWGADAVTYKIDESMLGNTVTFYSGVIMTVSSLLAVTPDLVVAGSAGNNTIVGWKQLHDRLDGMAGDDLLDGSGGNDTLTGGEGNDTLIGGTGNDRLVAVADDGTSSGNDTYVFAGLFGHDTIHEHDGGNEASAGASGFDVIRLEGINAGQVSTRKVDVSHLELSVAQGTSSVLFNVAPLARNGGSTEGIERIEFTDGTAWDTASLLRALSTITGGESADQLSLRSEGDTVSGLGGDDTLTGGPGAGVFSGGSGRDTVQVAGNGAVDRVLFGLGDGQDNLLVDHLDVIELGTGLSQSAMKVSPLALGSPAGSPVTLSWASGESLTLADAGSWDGLTVRFDGGSTLSGSSIISLARLAAEPPPPPNLLKTGTTGRDSLAGGAGNDTLKGLAGDDLLTGGAGNDLLDGERGNDTLRGGTGNDRLIGGRGNDSYVFARGDGQDTIVDQDSTLFNTDVLSISGANRSQVWLVRNGADLDISIIGTTDKVSIAGWFSSSANRVERIVVDGGKTLSSSSVNMLVNAMAAFEPPPLGASAMSPSVETQLGKVLNASWR